MFGLWTYSSHLLSRFGYLLGILISLPLLALCFWSKFAFLYGKTLFLSSKKTCNGCTSGQFIFLRWKINRKHFLYSRILVNQKKLWNIKKLPENIQLFDFGNYLTFWSNLFSINIVTFFMVVSLILCKFQELLPIFDILALCSATIYKAF